MASVVEIAEELSRPDVVAIPAFMIHFLMTPALLGMQADQPQPPKFQRIQYYVGTFNAFERAVAAVLDLIAEFKYPSIGQQRSRAFARL
jgi:hypothetical protein